MEIILLMLMAWVPEAYFAATDGIEAIAWGVVATLLTALAISIALQDDKKSASRGND